MAVVIADRGRGARFRRDRPLTGAVAVVPLVFDAEGIPRWLVEQYRPAFDRIILEIPAGCATSRVNPSRRRPDTELAEEAGLVPERSTC